jgi:hypothetical protein
MHSQNGCRLQLGRGNVSPHHFDVSHFGVLRKQFLCAEEAAGEHEAVFRAWREQPHDFEINDRRPVDEVFAAAKSAWEGDAFLRPPPTA